MSCTRVRPWIPRYVEGELPPEETLELARHVDRCTPCRIVLARERRLGEILNGIEDPLDVDASFLEGVMAALPERTVPVAIEPAGRRRWRRGLKLAGMSAVAVLGAGALARLAPSLRFDPVAPALPRFTAESADGWLGVLGSTVQWVRLTAETLGWGRGPRWGGALSNEGIAALALAAAATVAFASVALALAARAFPREARERAPSAASSGAPQG